VDYWYVYAIHEFLLVEPFYVKVGFAVDPVRRLGELQDGNPRFLRAADCEQMPTKPFGLRCESEKEARQLENAVHQRLRTEGYCLRKDFNYGTERSSPREWYSNIRPHDVWMVVCEEWRKLRG